MRSRRMRLAFLAAAVLFRAPRLSADEVTRTLSAELTAADLPNFSVENLVGAMRISPGTGSGVTVTATVHAETPALAGGVRLERVAGQAGAATLRVRYPEGIRTIRYPPLHGQDGDLTISISLFSLDASRYDYDGHAYRVASGHGKRLWADLEIRVPPQLSRARFQNLVGLIVGAGFEGDLRFDVASADLRLRQLGGELSFTGSSGDIRATDIRGSWKSDFSSGDCELEHFDGETLSFTTSSGDIRARQVRANRVAIDTSSGNASIREADLEEFRGEASSGDLLLEAEGSRLKEVRAHTSSGNVTVRLPSDAAFDAAADQSSGDMEVGFTGGSSIRRDDKLVAYRLGHGGPRIRVETSSGDLAILPR